AYEYTMHPIKLERMIRTLDPQYEQIEGNDIPASLNRFVKGYHVDLLAIVPHKQGQLKNIFIKSTTHSMVFDTYVPLLILPESDQKN
ncbi:MAG: hypothetical protein ACXWCZ_11550, partial [Flavisolibacter sp.]